LNSSARLVDRSGRRKLAAIEGETVVRLGGKKALPRKTAVGTCVCCPVPFPAPWCGC